MTTRADKAAFKWLRERHPDWSDAQVSHLIARSRMIDEHPNWSDAEIDREILRRASGGQESEEK
jgi:hypothetical protein